MGDFIKFVIGTLLGIIVALLVAFNILLLWVATGPRSLDRISPYIAAAFEPADEGYHVKIGHTWLIWDGWQHPIDIRLRDITVLTKRGQVFSKFPEISLGLDPLGLARMRVLPTSLSITHPVISLFAGEDHSINFGLDAPPPAAPASPAAEEPGSAPPEDMVPFAAVVMQLLTPDDSSGLYKLRSINILDADVSIGSVKKGVFFKANHTNIVFKHDRDGNAHAEIEGRIRYGEYRSTISGHMTMSADNPVIEGEINFGQLMPGTLAALFSDNAVLSAVHFPMNGNAKLYLDKSGALQKLGFSLDGGHGTIETDKLEGKVPVNSLHVEGELSNHNSDITIAKLVADLGGIMVNADGTVSLNNGDTAVHGNVTFKNATADSVRLLWPPGLSPESRKWVVENITGGNVPEAAAHINIALGDLAKPVLPKDDIDAAITLEGAKVRYLPEHPEATNVKGVVHVNALNLSADITTADYMKDTKLSNGKMLIEDLNADNPYIKLDFEVATSAKDAVKFLGLPRLKHAERLNLHEETAEGSLKGKASLGFHFFAPRDEHGNPKDDDLSFDIAGDAKAVSVPGFMKKFDIKNADGSLSVNNTGIEYKGTGEINGAAVSSSDIRYQFHPDDKGLDTFIQVTASAPVAVLPRFGYPQFPFLKGAIGVKADVKQGDKAEFYDASIDLTNATVVLADFGWNKPEKEPATFEMKADKQDGSVHIPSFHLTGRDMDSKGSGDLGKDFVISHVEMDQVRYGSNDLSHVIYNLIDGGWQIEAEGKSADLTSWLGGKDTGSFSFEHFPAFLLDANVGRVILGKNRVLSEVKGSATCDLKRCSEVNVAGKTIDGKPAVFRILRNPKGVRQLSVHAQSAGAFLKAIGVMDGMDGGDLTITGNYDDSAASSVLKGRVDINEHTVKDAPILAKILSLASLTGFFDTLRGKGIEFTRLIIPFTLANDVITLENAKTHGDAIGMTADGTITFPKKMLDIKGTIVPSYTLNSVLGKVPLLGHILTGGEGQGVFAARYSVRGSVENPDVSVNPLAILTPGFLRGVFDIMDMPDKKESE